MIRKEQQMIRTAILALLVVLTMVYLLVYSIYYRPSTSSGESLTGSDSPADTLSPAPGIINHVDEISVPASDETISHVVISQDIPESPAGSPGSVTLGTNGISASEVVGDSTTTDTQRILPGTRLVTQQTIADEIGVDYRYTLRDSEGIYYLNLGSSTQDLGALLQGQGGNTFALTTSSKILANKLFGSRVVFLNLPQYQNKTVLMVVTVGSERRLIQIPYSIYHESKSTLAKKFN